MLSDEIQQIADTVERLRRELDDLTVRGLHTIDKHQLREVATMGYELEAAGASHLATSISAVVRAVEADDADAPAALLRAQATLRLFDRVLTLEVADAAMTTLTTRARPCESAGTGRDEDGAA